MKKLLLICALLASQPALAQKAAPRDIAGHLYCSGDIVDIRETGDGKYKVDIVVESRGDAAKAVYPAGGRKLFGTETELRSYVSINYAFLLDAAGNPVSRPEPVRVSVSTGRFDGPRLEPLGSLSLVLRAGATTSPPFRLNSAYYGIALIGGEVAPTGSDNPYDSELPQDALNALVSAFENSGERWLILSQNGTEAARIPVPQIDLVPIRNKALAWVRQAAPLIKQGKCPA